MLYSVLHHRLKGEGRHTEVLYSNIVGDLQFITESHLLQGKVGLCMD